MENQINVLNKNNLLIQSNYSLNALQNKYYLTILYNMQKENNAEYRCDIHLDTFKSLSSNKTFKSLNGVKDVLHILMEKRIELRRLKGDKKGHVYFTRNIING
ncbi:MAG: RepB family plasmid replication initiator protein, partial [Paraclostridium sp.]